MPRKGEIPASAQRYSESSVCLSFNRFEHHTLPKCQFASELLSASKTQGPSKTMSHVIIYRKPNLEAGGVCVNIPTLFQNKATLRRPARAPRTRYQKQAPLNTYSLIIIIVIYIKKKLL